MGRRALPPVDPTLDLADYLKRLEDLPCPWSSEALFGRCGPLELEIGSGKGLFLSAAAATDPEANFLGVEIAAKYARFAAARLAKRQLGNARVVHGDAVRIMRAMIPDGALRAVHVYFPDPWWKARHKKRRVMNRELVGHIERTLEAGGRLHFWTDVEEYYLTSLEVIRASTRLEGPFAVGEKPADHDLDYRTHFERRMRLGGLPVYRAEFCKPL